MKLSSPVGTKALFSFVDFSDLISPTTTTGEDGDINEEDGDYKSLISPDYPLDYEQIPVTIINQTPTTTPELEAGTTLSTEEETTTLAR